MYNEFMIEQHTGGCDCGADRFDKPCECGYYQQLKEEIQQAAKKGA